MEEIRKIGVLISGNDAPGMNAAIRTVVRACIHYGFEVNGIRPGYQDMIGIVNNEIVHLPLNRAVKLHKNVNHKLLELTHILI
jgi:6-phosphofructokinase 1